MLKRWCVALGLWLARLGGWTPPPPPVCELLHVPPAKYMVSARRIAAEVERIQLRNGQAKRDAALRALLNLHPGAKERDLMLALELVVQQEAR